MKITIAPFNPNWAIQFEDLKKELLDKIGALNPVIEHIGSTSVPGLAAKPIIDISVGLSSENEFEKTIHLMHGFPYIYYEVFNSTMPNRRLFLRLKDETPENLFPTIFTEKEDIPHEKINDFRMAHVHVWQFGTSDWIRHIAFREYLKENDAVRKEYEAIKKGLSKKNWADGMEYNKGKDRFIKKTEVDAMKWYQSK